MDKKEIVPLIEGMATAEGTLSFVSRPQQPEPRDLVKVNIRSLLDAGAHYGHQTDKWCPKMLQYIFSERNGIHIINLDITLKLWEKARKFIIDKMSSGGEILFVGTKTQVRDIMAKEATRCGAFSVTTKWLGGTLSNFETIKRSIERISKLEDFLTMAAAPDSKVNLHKKEKLEMTRELGKLNSALGGIRSMKRIPDLLFVVDILKESIAVAEARKLHIPVIALVDTNVDPDKISFPVPSNDDASRTVSLFAGAVSDAVSEGKKAYQRKLAEDSVRHEETEENGIHSGVREVIINSEEKLRATSV